MVNYTSETPDAIKLSDSTKHFLTMLDELHAYKQFVIAEQETFLNPALNTNLNSLKAFLKECTGIEAIAGLPRAVFENLIFNARNIFALKGTKKGLELFTRCAALGDFIWKSGSAYPDVFIVLSDYSLGYLPNGSDLGLHTTNDADSHKFIWLYGGNNEEYYQDIELMIFSPYFGITEFREWFLSILPMFLPIVDPNSANIKVMMYSHDYVGLPFTYNTNL
jgi:hypothetical protein